VPVAIERRALVLNQNYEPLNVCAVRRAFVLVYHGKAEVIETADDAIHGVDTDFPLPSVIRLRQPVKRPRPRVRLTRKEVFARDDHRCQYCGAAGLELTIDHVMPRHRGGPHEWENLVAACRACNHHKGGRTPAEARMRLLREPIRPAATPAALFGQYLDRYREWRPFLLGWMDRGARAAVAAS
jgi:5-methylcytosine-specific restriction endonuclease McrA